jgi:hypothetical protein
MIRVALIILALHIVAAWADRYEPPIEALAMLY